MKTAFRKILCAALALIMAFASVPAFAAEIGDNVKWVFYDPDDKIYLRDFYYAGTVQEGKNKLVYNVGDTGRQYYEFEAEKTGYYLLSTPGVAACFGQPDSEGKINRIDTPWEYIESNDNCTEYTLIYLTKDVYTVGIEFWDTTKEENLTIEFLSSEIVDLEYNQSDFDSRIINDDIYITEFKNGFTYNIYSEHTNITFSGGKKLVDYSVYLTFTANEKLTDGVHNGKIGLMNYEENGHSSIYHIDRVIKSIELKNTDDYLVAFEWYNGRYSFPDFNDEVTVNYFDGTSETFVYGHNEKSGEKDCISLWGNEKYLSIVHSEQDLTLRVRVSQHTFIEKKCSKTIKTSPTQNANYLKENLEWRYNRFNHINSNIMEDMKEARSIDSILQHMKRFFHNLSLLAEMGEEVISFIKFVS